MANFLKTKRGKNLLNMVYGFGASIVMIGAWAKLLHLPGANTALTIGLLTEAVIFAITAFDFPDPGYDWTLVHPELAGGQNLDSKKKKVRSASQQLDEMLAKAKMGPELIDSLQHGFSRLNDNVSHMADLSGATMATEEYAVNVKNAASTVGQLGDAAGRALEGMSGLAADGDLAQQYHVQVQSLVKNLSALNANYELEQETAAGHLSAMNKFYDNLSASAGALSASVDDANKYKDEIGKLQRNLTALNAVYGNMLTAMNPKVNV